MTRLSKVFVAALALQMALATSPFAAEEIGKAVAITVSVTGDDGPLSVSSPIHRDERIQTSSSGTGQFVFRDGTKLAVGPGSTLVLDRSVFVGSSAFKSLGLKATRGTFRWISGTSKSSAYKINTPFGTLGIRGTAFDFYVSSKTAAIILLEGRAEFCGNNGVCKRLTGGCDMVTANRNGVMGESRKPSKTAVAGVKNQESFPFLVGTRKLNRPFQVGGSCGLSRTAKAGGEGGSGGGTNGRGVASGSDNTNGPVP